MTLRIGYAAGAFDLFHVGPPEHSSPREGELRLPDRRRRQRRDAAAGEGRRSRHPDRRARRDRAEHPVRRRGPRRDGARQARHLARGRVHPLLQGRRLARHREGPSPRARVRHASASRSSTSRTPSTPRARRCAARSRSSASRPASAVPSPSAPARRSRLRAAPVRVTVPGIGQMVISGRRPPASGRNERAATVGRRQCSGPRERQP